MFEVSKFELLFALALMTMLWLLSVEQKKGNDVDFAQIGIWSMAGIFMPVLFYMVAGEVGA